MSIIKTAEGYEILRNGSFKGVSLTNADAAELMAYLTSQEILEKVKTEVDGRNSSGAFDSLPFSLTEKLTQACCDTIEDEMKSRAAHLVERTVGEYDDEIYNALHPAVSLEALFEHLANGKDVDTVKTAYGEIHHNKESGEYIFFEGDRMKCDNGDRINRREVITERTVLVNSSEYDDDVCFKLTAEEYEIAVRESTENED